MQIDTKLIMQLRNQTGAGIKDCQEILAETNGDLNKAMELLRKKGAKIAGKRAEKEAKEGIIYAYIHANNKIGAMIELNCETDFVAKNENFKAIAHDIAMQIAAQNPLYIAPADVPEEIINKEKEIYKEQLLAEGKPENMLDKIIEGKISKWYQDVCLLKQPFIKDEDITIEDYLNEKIASIGEKIKIGSFSRKQI
jgi:elongation factor Ts